MQTPAARPYFVTVGISVKTMTHNFAKISLWVENFLYELQKNIKCCDSRTIFNLLSFTPSWMTMWGIKLFPQWKIFSHISPLYILTRCKLNFYVYALIFKGLKIEIVIKLSPQPIGEISKSRQHWSISWGI